MPALRIYGLAPRLALTLALVLLGLLVAVLAGATLSSRDTIRTQAREQAAAFEHGAVSALHSVMLAGDGSLALTWLERLRSYPQVRSAEVLRRNGEVAFRDLDTLRKVNAYMGRRAFERDPRPVARIDLPPDLREHVLQGEAITRDDWSADTLLRLRPIANGPECRRCHGYDRAPVLGFLHVTMTTGFAADRIEAAYWRNISAGIAAWLLVTLLALLVVRQRIVRPLRALGGVAQRIGEGELDARVQAPSQGRSDELADLAGAMNHMADRLARTMSSLREAVTEVPIGMLVVDRRGVVLFVNPAAEAALGRSSEQLEGSELGIPIGGGEPVEMDIRRPDGAFGIAEVHVRPITWQGRAAYLVALHDVTERRREAEAASYRAAHDDLTGLANRGAFFEHLREAIERARRSDERLAVLFVDLDRFKAVNDRLGHAAGDELLREMRRRLQARVRSADIVARLAGDEFTVLLHGIREEADAVAVADKLRTALEAPVNLGDEIASVGASIGVSVFPDEAGDPEGLLMQADAAMYRAKESGRGQVRGSGTAPAHGGEAGVGAGLSTELGQALADEALCCLYQPEMRLSDGHLQGLEALLRWDRGEKAMLLPGAFLRHVEEAGLGEAVGERVLRIVCADLAAWQEAGLSVVRVWINLSAAQLRNPQLPDQVAAIAEEAGIRAGLLGFDLTEAAAAADLDQSLRVLEGLKRMGCGVSLDDFGQGYSALNLVKALPAEVIKIDASLTAGLPGDADAAAMVRAIIAMAHGLQRSALAEGVETREQVDHLRAAGCDCAQGYFFGRPRSPEKARQLLRARGL